MLPEFLRTLSPPSDNPFELRAALLRDLKAATGADAGMCYAVVRIGDEEVMRIQGMIALGPSGFAETYGQTEGAPVMRYADLRSIVSIQAFELLSSDNIPEPIVDSFWVPFGLHSAVAVNLLDDDGHHLAHFCVFRADDSAPFEDTVPDALAPRIAPYRALLMGSSGWGRDEGLEAIFRTKKIPLLVTLGRRQRHIAQLVAHGCAIAAIAAELGEDEAVVRRELASVYEQLEIEDAAALAAALAEVR